MTKLKDYGRPCEGVRCKNSATEVHHKDHDHGNNEPSNLRYLCASCHRKEHFDYMDDENELNRSKDIVDELLPQKVGYRLEAGFNLINED